MCNEFKNLKKVVLDEKEEAIFQMANHDLHSYDRNDGLVKINKCERININPHERSLNCEKTCRELKKIRLYNLLDKQAKFLIFGN